MKVFPQCSQEYSPPSRVAPALESVKRDGAAGPGAGGSKKSKGYGDGSKLLARSWRKALAISSSSSENIFDTACGGGGRMMVIFGVGGITAGALSLGSMF